MNAKHQFKYTYDGGCEDFSPVEVTFEIPGEVTINQMLYNFEYYLKACGFHFDGHLEIVDETLDNIDIADEVYGCMADFDKECGCETTSSPCETSKWDEQFDVTRTTSSSLGDSISTEEYQKQQLKNWNKGIAKLDNELKEQREIREKAYKSAEMCAEVAKNKWVHGMCNPPSPDWKKSKL